jgi:hypothetical protein
MDSLVPGEGYNAQFVPAHAGTQGIYQMGEDESTESKGVAEVSAMLSDGKRHNTVLVDHDMGRWYYTYSALAERRRLDRMAAAKPAL